ncbi:MAG: NADH-quinone oxidoreductase subunit NuoK [Bacteroidaceae bacterium]|jgi:NADH-quinone oxidoreductase subunit K
MEIQLEYYLIISLVMMACGVYGFLSRRNTLAMLISVELMLNAADINFAAFNRYLFANYEGHFFAIFGIAIAAAETAVAIAIMINIYRNLKSIQTKDIEDLKH